MMRFRIRAGCHESYLTRSSIRSVVKIAREKARQRPLSEKISVYCGNVLIVEITRMSLFEGLIPRDEMASSAC